MKNGSRVQSFKHAICGICKTAKTEKNFRIQLLMGIIAIIVCIVLRVEVWHYVMVVFAMFFVLAMELVNTAIEALTDLSCESKIHPLAKIAKDAAAGAVLLASASAAVVGVVVIVSIIRR